MTAVWPDWPDSMVAELSDMIDATVARMRAQRLVGRPTVVVPGWIPQADVDAFAAASPTLHVVRAIDLTPMAVTGSPGPSPRPRPRPSDRPVPQPGRPSTWPGNR